MSSVVPLAPPLAVSPLGLAALGFAGVAGEIAARLRVARVLTRVSTAGLLVAGLASTADVSPFGLLSAIGGEPTGLRVAPALARRPRFSAAALVPVQLTPAFLASGRVRVSSLLPSVLRLALALVRFDPAPFALGDESSGLGVPALSLGLRSAFVAAALVPPAPVSLAHEFRLGNDRRGQKADRPFRNQRAVTRVRLAVASLPNTGFEKGSN